MAARHTIRTLLGALVVTGLALATLTAAPPAGADEACTATWAGGTGAWDDAARWSPAGVPEPDDVVCIGREAGAPASTVRVGRLAEVASLTLTGATLAIAPDTYVLADQFAANRATLTGGGTLAGSFGITAIADTRLAGVRVTTPGRLRLAGRIPVTGGATVTQTASGAIDLLPGLQVVDADGNPGNHLQFKGFPLYLTGTVFLGVRVALVDLILLAQGDVTLAALDNLDADGVLRPGPGGRTLQLGTGSSGTLHLPRTVTRIARGVDVYAGRLETGNGDDALAGLRVIDGGLGRTEPLVLDQPLTVGGRFSSSSTVAGSGVLVRHGATFAAARVDGELRSAGSCDLTGSRVGRLVLLAGSDTTTDLSVPLTVVGRATLAGSLTARLRSGRPPATGTSFVLLTAAQGITGRFDTVATDRPSRAALTPDYRPTWLSGTVAAPTG